MYNYIYLYIYLIYIIIMANGRMNGRNVKF